MPEAVIVATARSPDRPGLQGVAQGPAARRPDRPDRPRRAGQGARSSTRTTSTTCCWAAACPAASRATTWPASWRCCSATTTCPARRSPATARPRCRPPGWPSTRSRPARATCSSPPASRRVSRFAKGSSDGLPDTQNPLFAEAAGPHRQGRPRAAHQAGTTRARTASSPTSTSRWARPPRTSPSCEGVSREEQDEFGVRSQNLAEKAIANGFLEREITPVTLPDGTVVSKDDGPRAGVTHGGGLRAQAGLPAGRHGHRRQLLPAQRRRRRGRRHERHQGRRARPHPARPDRRPPASPACPPRSWASARSRRPGRRSRSAGHDHRRHRPRRDQRGVRRAGHPLGRGPRHRPRQAQRQRRRDRASATRSA